MCADLCLICRGRVRTVLRCSSDTHIWLLTTIRLKDGFSNRGYSENEREIGLEVGGTVADFAFVREFPNEVSAYKPR